MRLCSIPVLQNFIVPARVEERDGKFFQQKNGKEYEVPPPITLRENIDYIVDGQYAFKGQMTFQTGVWMYLRWMMELH